MNVSLTHEKMSSTSDDEMSGVDVLHDASSERWYCTHPQRDAHTSTSRVCAHVPSFTHIANVLVQVKVKLKHSEGEVKAYSVGVTRAEWNVEEERSGVRGGQASDR